MSGDEVSVCRMCSLVSERERERTVNKQGERERSQGVQRRLLRLCMETLSQALCQEAIALLTPPLNGHHRQNTNSSDSHASWRPEADAVVETARGQLESLQKLKKETPQILVFQILIFILDQWVQKARG